MSITWEKHPILQPPTLEEELHLLENDPAAYEELWKAYHKRIEASRVDPLAHGFRFPSWNLVIEQLQKWMEVWAAGGNGGSKSELGAYLVCLCLEHNPGAQIYCFSQDDDASTQIQQAYIWKYLPARFRHNHKTEAGGYIKYSSKNGFTDNSFILDVGDGTAPRKCFFYKYSQYQANKHKFEGYEYGSRECQPFSLPEQRIIIDGDEWIIPAMKDITLNIGAWLDEYLESGELYETLLYRIPRRGSSIFSTFTAIEGMTPFVASKYKGGAVTKTIPTNPRLFNHETEPKEVEWVREKRNSDAKKAGVGMVFMPSEHNPWAGFDNMLILHRHKSLEERLVRFHGIPSDLITNLFPHFSLDVNVIDELPSITPETHTVYVICDPAGARNYFFLWAAIDRHGMITVLREWPDRGSYGDWAEFATPKWKPGPASKKVGYDVQGYIDLIKGVEEEMGLQEVFQRVGDCRFFANGDADNIDLFARFAEKGMWFEPSLGITEEEGIIGLNEWFYYNQDRPVDEANCPRIRIHKSCGNLIFALLNYTIGEGKKYEALKDPIDALRYLRTTFHGSGPLFHDKKVMEQEIETWGY